MLLFDLNERDYSFLTITALMLLQYFGHTALKCSIIETVNFPIVQCLLPQRRTI
jgi:hypothetical protein